MNNKIQVKSANKDTIRVLAFGTFDFLHPGHFYYLSQAKKMGDELIVIVARDSNVKRIKGEYPYFPETERLDFVKALSVVDSAILGNKGTNYLKSVVDLKPNIIVLGYDHLHKEEILEKNLLEKGINCKVLRAESLKPEIFKSSIIKEKFL